MPLTDTLVSYLKLDESSGTPADSHGGLTFTNVGTATYTTGKLNNGITLNGSSQAVVSTETALKLTGGLTISLWLKLSSTAGGAAGLCCCCDSGLGAGCYGVEVNRTAGKITLLDHGYDNIIRTSTTTLSTGTWYHVLVTRSGSSGAWTWKLFINGAQEGADASDASNPSTTSVSFGLGRYGASSSGFVPGMIDEFGIFSSALNQTDIDTLYGSGTPPAYPFSGGALTTGAASYTSATVTTITVTCGAATGGTSPYTYQWYRSTTSGFTPDGGNLLSGATSLTLNDSASLSLGVDYFYKLVSTDSAGSPATVTSNQVSGRLWNTIGHHAFAGDSRMAGDVGPVTTTPPESFADSYVNVGGSTDATVYNFGHDNATMADWKQGAGSGYLTALLAGIPAGAMVHLAIGVNSAAVGVSVASFTTDLADFCAGVVATGRPVMLHLEPLINPAGSFAGSGYDEACLARQIEYQAAVRAQCDESTIFLGDVYAASYYAERTARLQADGVHQNEQGSIDWGRLLASAAMRVINPEQPTSGGGSGGGLIGASALVS